MHLNHDWEKKMRLWNIYNLSKHIADSVCELWKFNARICKTWSVLEMFWSLFQWGLSIWNLISARCVAERMYYIVRPCAHVFASLDCACAPVLARAGVSGYPLVSLGWVIHWHHGASAWAPLFIEAMSVQPLFEDPSFHIHLLKSARNCLWNCWEWRRNWMERHGYTCKTWMGSLCQIAGWMWQGYHSQVWHHLRQWFEAFPIESACLQWEPHCRCNAAACAKRFSGIASKSGNRSSACIWFRSIDDSH